MKTHVPDWLLHLLQRPVAVFGAGVSGRGASGLVAYLGGEAIIYDREAQRGQDRHFGAEAAARHGLVIVSPGFAPDHAWVQSARQAGCEVLAEIDFASLAWPGEIIAITGTNGKTTLTEFLTHALKVAGRDARAVGNIGEAFSDAWLTPCGATSVAVCEVSSFQAELLHFFEASATLWSNFAEDHLERHRTMERYFAAKYTIVKRTRDRLVFHGPSVQVHAKSLGFDMPVGRCVPFNDIAVDGRIGSTVFGRLPQRENFILAQAFWRHLGLDDELLVNAACTFRIGPHRLARVGEVRGVSFWNDSKGTNFHAVEAALASFERPLFWIGGGRAKGGDVEAFVTRIAPRVRQAFLIGETRDVLAAAFRETGVPARTCESLRSAVIAALGEAGTADHVLLSPAFASFDMFKGYDDRGRQFESIVSELAIDPRERASTFSFKPSTIRETLSLL